MEKLSKANSPYELTQQYISDSHVLKQPLGYELVILQSPNNKIIIISFPIDSYCCSQIEHNFKTLYPESKRRFSTYWPVFAQKIKTEAGKHGVVNLGNRSCQKKLLRQLIIIYIIHILVKQIFFTIVISAIKNSKRKVMEDEQS